MEEAQRKAIRKETTKILKDANFKYFPSLSSYSEEIKQEIKGTKEEKKETTNY
jgi:hypothetical protein